MQNWSSGFCLLNAFFRFISALRFAVRWVGATLRIHVQCACVHLWFHQFEFNDIRVESNTYCNWDQASETRLEQKLYRFFSRLLLVFFSCLISRCYHFIIRPKNNKNKSLMLCFTLLSHRILNPCSVKPVAILFCCCWCCSCFVSCAWAHTSFRAVCIGIRWIDVNQSQSHKVNIKNGKRKTMALEKINVLDILKWASTTTDTRACEMDRERARS